MKPSEPDAPTTATSSVPGEHPAPAAADRLVMSGAHGQWEVRPPYGPGAALRADSRASAVQWAWNITRDTGGRVLLAHRSEGTRTSGQGSTPGP